MRIYRSSHRPDTSLCTTDTKITGDSTYLHDVSPSGGDSMRVHELATIDKFSFKKSIHYTGLTEEMI